MAARLAEAAPQAAPGPADTSAGGATLSTAIKHWIWVMVGAVLLGLLSGGLALWTTRLAGTGVTPTTTVLLGAIYATGIAAGMLVATAAVAEYD